MTGMGLMFTFLAILIGLGKLHANGTEIDGIQGLINGLSGKFVTSIVGLACANAFTLLEHSLWHRLDNRHRECISLLDEMFPQKTAEQHTQASSTAEWISTCHPHSHPNRYRASACRGRAAAPRIHRCSPERRIPGAHGSEFQTFTDEA